MDEDHELIDRILNNESRLASTQLIEKYKKRVYSYCLRIVRNESVAEELAQDAFLKALKKLSTLRDKQKFLPWLMRLTNHIAIDFVRKKNMRHDVFEDGLGLVAEDDQHQTMVDNDRKRMIEQILMKFPTEERSILTLYYMEDLSIKEIEGITGLSTSNIKVKLFRSREKLRKALSKIVKML